MTTTTPRPLHQLVVTKVPDDHDDDITYSVTCPTPQPAHCRVWWPCPQCTSTARPATTDEEGAGEYEAHGVEHRRIDSDWMTESTECALTATETGMESAQANAERLGLGTHDVDVDYWGDGQWDVIIPTLEAAA